MPAAFCILGLQRCGAMHVGPVHRQPGARLRARQRDVECMDTALASGNGYRTAALPQRRGLRGIESEHARTERRIERFHFEDRHAPVGGALRTGQAQVAGLAWREVQRFDAAE
ncbi:hypothetical protein G6F63_015059 [Rhizopus arrhizus]|nr:hypothetical protein G6F63_015059 [Rhizopus arrhizus]KAG1357275.1 hypothetical protein G6F61_014581 [Rhizopus arrhizus]